MPITPMPPAETMLAHLLPPDAYAEYMRAGTATPPDEATMQRLLEQHVTPEAVKALHSEIIAAHEQGGAWPPKQ